MKHTVYRSFAKANVFLKITGTRGNYHELLSRFVLLPQLFDNMWFERSDGNGFEIIGNFDCETKENTIYKAYRALVEYRPDKRIVEFCRTHKLFVYKNIPAGAGLGGGSSNAATFLKMLNETLSLGLLPHELAKAGESVGADVPFFVYDYASANVSGIGEIVEPFDEQPPFLQIITPDIHCDTKEVYRTYRKHFLDTIDTKLAQNLSKMSSSEILQKYEPQQLNDLFPAALKKYPELYDHKQEGLFFSGSGSSFFKPKQSA